MERTRLKVDWGNFWGAIWFLVIGGGFAIFGGYQIWVTTVFLRNAEPVRAVVLENPSSCDDDGCSWWPRVSYVTPEGISRETKTQFGSSSYGWNEGAEIDILHNPAFDYIRIPGGDNLYLLGGAFFVLGSLPVVIAIWILFRRVFSRVPVGDETR
ncbi:MAG: DUF3592 domain-containing protein [Pseudomonadota bacterium]